MGKIKKFHFTFIQKITPHEKCFLIGPQWYFSLHRHQVRFFPNACSCIFFPLLAICFHQLSLHNKWLLQSNGKTNKTSIQPQNQANSNQHSLLTIMMTFAVHSNSIEMLFMQMEPQAKHFNNNSPASNQNYTPITNVNTIFVKFKSETTTWERN